MFFTEERHLILVLLKNLINYNTISKPDFLLNSTVIIVFYSAKTAKYFFMLCLTYCSFYCEIQIQQALINSHDKKFDKITELICPSFLGVLTLIIQSVCHRKDLLHHV